MTELVFLNGVDPDYVLERLAKAGGKEIESDKLLNADSSAALAVNTFGWFAHRPHLLPAFPGVTFDAPPTCVDVEYCARFPWHGGRHPWLDAVVPTPGSLIGVESKRFEPFRDRKSAVLSAAYNRPVWGDGMKPFEAMRDQLQRAPNAFRYLDAAQLVKHAFGLVTDARRQGKSPKLIYLFAEPARLGGKPIGSEMRASHRSEVEQFAAAVAGAEVVFSAMSYREWLANWRACSTEVRAHADAIVARFDP